MECPHCCFSCTAKGQDMSMETFKKVVKITKEFNSPICLGGGEPTLHPLFKDMLMHAVGELDEMSKERGIPYVSLVTNGSITPIALTLAQMAKEGVIRCNLSQDGYHDDIDAAVVKAFERPVCDTYDKRDYRQYNTTAPDRIQRMGRAKTWGSISQTEGCCGGVMTTPGGVLYPCMCRRKSIGTVDNPHSLVREHFTENICIGSVSYKEKVLPAIKEKHKEKQWVVSHITDKQEKETANNLEPCQV